MKAIVNGRVIVPGEDGHFLVADDRALLFDEHSGEILDVTEADSFIEQQVAGNLPELSEVIDADGGYVAPGFINVHVHGAMGYDTMDASYEALNAMAVQHATAGATGFLPTTITAPMERKYRAMENIRSYMAAYRGGMLETEGAKVLGCHLEGPFVSKAKNGAQPEQYILKPDFDLIKDYTDVLRLITVAPEELPEGSDFSKKCIENGVVMSIGHTAADYNTAVDAAKNKGMKHFTHMFNAMSGLHHREPGVIGAILDTEDTYAEIITDNIHVRPEVQRIVYRIKGSHMVVITDALRPCGLGDGESELGGQPVFVHGLEARLSSGTLAGSVVPMNIAVANFAANIAPLGRGIADAVECATASAAKSINMYDSIGSLEAGKRADIVIFDDALDISMTIVDGRMVYEKEM